MRWPTATAWRWSALLDAPDITHLRAGRQRPACAWRRWRSSARSAGHHGRQPGRDAWAHFGGIYIGGGIVPRLGAVLRPQSPFRERFEDKGRFKPTTCRGHPHLRHHGRATPRFKGASVHPRDSQLRDTSMASPMARPSWARSAAPADEPVAGRAARGRAWCWPSRARC